MQHNPEFLKIAEQARNQIQEVSIEEVHTWQKNKKAFQLIDVREDNEWQQQHIINAIHIGKGVIERDIEAKIPDKNTQLVLYCGGGYRSALAAKQLQEMGYNNVFSMAGGFKAWQTANFPIIK